MKSSSTNDRKALIELSNSRITVKRQAELLNSVRVGTYQPDYIKLLEECGVKISMNGKGQCLGNARTERFFRTLRYDRIYINEYSTPRELRAMLSEYMETYTSYRPLILHWTEHAPKITIGKASSMKLLNTHGKKINLNFQMPCLDNGEGITLQFHLKLLRYN